MMTETPFPANLADLFGPPVSPAPEREPNPRRRPQREPEVLEFIEDPGAVAMLIAMLVAPVGLLVVVAIEIVRWLA